VAPVVATEGNIFFLNAMEGNLETMGDFSREGSIDRASSNLKRVMPSHKKNIKHYKTRSHVIKREGPHSLNLKGFWSKEKKKSLNPMAFHFSFSIGLSLCLFLSCVLLSLSLSLSLSLFLSLSQICLNLHTRC
jgi:hypothetical protein